MKMLLFVLLGFILSVSSMSADEEAELLFDEFDDDDLDNAEEGDIDDDDDFDFDDEEFDDEGDDDDFEEGDLYEEEEDNEDEEDDEEEYELTQEWAEQAKTETNPFDQIESAERLLAELANHPYHGMYTPN
ncbi:hypothetical protein EIN_253360 [Entamoeba invadens IP1]|uniref:Uncharacterized protein n=1 Tax=Entamoeba invadens IP1 TaxID=370355 RepID=A0A0A1UHC3_ENTIV|nr:hypothetical protein EIN_253360 [Entamoeba invadens IP1]ELP95072.1 hypothetical protein EIN_253360 [Entamoeba invadens IP1]|eukprot:XP_004261843.1 hypothetical protein EIN_253360 [Entamoeba invadens IP1]